MSYLPATLHIAWRPVATSLARSRPAMPGVDVPLQIALRTDFQQGLGMRTGVKVWGSIRIPERSVKVATVEDREVRQRSPVLPDGWFLRLLAEKDPIFDQVDVLHEHYEVQAAFGFAPPPGARTLDLVRYEEPPPRRIDWDWEQERPWKVDLNKDRYDLTTYAYCIEVPQVDIIRWGPDAVVQAGVQVQLTLARLVGDMLIGSRPLPSTPRGVQWGEPPAEEPVPAWKACLGRLLPGVFLKTEGNVARVGSETIVHKRTIPARLPQFDASPSERRFGDYLSVSWGTMEIAQDYLHEAMTEGVERTPSMDSHYYPG